MEAASIEELHQKIQTLEKENNKEEEYRNYMQLERVRTNQVMLQQQQFNLSAVLLLPTRHGTAADGAA